jgi:hypothetical protein
MANTAKFLKLRFRVWWLIFFCIQGFLLMMMGVTLGVNDWVFTNNNKVLTNSDLLLEENDTDNYKYIGSDFEGTLTYCTKSCDESYGWLSSKWCSYAKDTKKEYEDVDSNYADPLYSVCGMFFTLAVGGSIYIVFEILAMIAVSIWACSMICYCKRVNCLCLSFCCACCTWTSHYVALILFMGFSNANFNKECDEFPDDDNRPKLCVGAGPEISLFILIALPFVVIWFYVVACKLQREFGCDGLSRDGANGHLRVPAPIIVQELSANPHPYVQYPQQAYYYPQPAFVPEFQQPYSQPPPVVYGQVPIPQNNGNSDIVQGPHDSQMKNPG